MSFDSAVLHALEAIAPVKAGEMLSRHTTIGIGGPADAYLALDTQDQITGVLRVAHDAGLPVFILGSGSNIVIGDRGIRGITIENNAHALSELGPLVVPTHAIAGEEPGRAQPSPDRPGLPSVPVEGGTDELTQTPADASTTPAAAQVQRIAFRAEAGCSFAAIARQLAFAGFEGLEWACGIPGTVGGAVVYNAGAYGGCLGDVLQRIAVWEPEHDVAEIDAADLGLVYRGSAFTRGVMAGRAVLWAEFALWRGDAAELRTRVADYDGRRLKAQPRGRNAGSFFKNPPEHPAWKLLDSVGLRGYQMGGAQFSDKHCNFLINAGDATAADVAALKRLAQDRVQEQFGLELQNEVTLFGEGFGDD